MERPATIQPIELVHDDKKHTTRSAVSQSRKLSLVVPVFNEEENVPILYGLLVEEVSPLAADFEILFVDDGSTDGSASAVEMLHRQDPRVKLISLSRNFGHQNALTAGMDCATGDAVIMMDADLQHPPRVIRELVRRWNEGFEVVYTIREEMEDAGPLKRLFSSFFYRLFRALSGLDLSSNAADFRLLDRKVVEAFGRIRERTRFLRGLANWVGFRSTAVIYEAPSRRSGESKYGARKMLRLAMDGLVSFSATPLYVAIYLGLALVLAGFGYLLYILYSRLVVGDVVPGWTSLIVIVMLIGGAQLGLTGIIGVYVGRIYEEAKQRPLYLISRRLGFADSSDQLTGRHAEAGP